MTSGILLMDKPSGWTSFDVVNYVRKIIATNQNKKPKQVKVGHTGTLDPLASGLLVLLIGDSTKQTPNLGKLDKTYEVTMRLGETSTTGDREGTVTKRSVVRPKQQALDRSLAMHTGRIMQTPPAYSAIKVDGQRAYRLARAGKPVEIEPRPVTIHSIQDVAYDYPNVSFTADVSSGTYIRSLVEDIGSNLGSGAYMTALRRIAVGNYRLADAVEVKSLDAITIDTNLQVIS